jgi:SEC-C motif-containing protein
MNTLCLCKSEKKYSECCQHYHDGFPPDNALALMRSRYSAYALHLVDYIIKTTHPQSPHYQTNLDAWKKDILAFSENTRFIGLTIEDFVDGEKEAQVTFTAYLMSVGQDTSFRERSLFRKEDAWWLYVSAL